MIGERKQKLGGSLRVAGPFQKVALDVVSSPLWPGRGGRAILVRLCFSCLILLASMEEAIFPLQLLRKAKGKC